MSVRGWSRVDSFLTGVAGVAIFDAAGEGWWGAILAAAWVFASAYVWEAHTQRLTAETFAAVRPDQPKGA